MPKLIQLPTFSDNRGQLTVIEKILKSSEIKFDKYLVRSIIDEKYNPSFQKQIFDNLILKC